MTVPSPNIAVYTETLVVTTSSQASLMQWANSLPAGPDRDRYLGDLTTAAQAVDIATAGFDTIIVGLLHVHEDGSIYCNDFPVNSGTFADICEGINALKTSPGSTVQTILFSFGGGNWAGHPASVSDSDYPAMKANWPGFKAALTDLLQTSGADGVDWDYEPVTVPFDTAFIIQITNEMAALPCLVTAAPYTDQPNWLTVIEGTTSGSGGNNFAWWNLQLYGGADYSDWVTALQGAPTGLGTGSVEAFLVPGYSPYDCSSSPAGEIQSLRNSYSSLNGAFIWNYSTIKDCAAEMASSIRAVFQPSSAPGAGQD
jgi:hypothetical protein